MLDKHLDKQLQQAKKDINKNNLACNNSCVTCSCRKKVKFTDFCKAKKRSLFTLHKTCDLYSPVSV